MICSTLIDLSAYNKKGVTIYLKLKDVRNTFLVEATDAATGKEYYKRLYDKSRLEFNLPVHPEKICVKVYGGPKLDNYIIGDMKVYQLPYKFNNDKRVYRPYDLGDITFQKVNGLPYGSEGRFLYDFGLMQMDESKLAHYPQPAVQFIQLHELGHYFYDDEREADRFALYGFVNQGYNFSGAQNYITETLGTDSHYNVYRILSIWDEINKMHSKILNR